MSKARNVVAIVVLIVIAWAAISFISILRQSKSSIFEPVSQIFNPTPTIIPDPVTIIHEVRSLARLETIHYSMEKLITAETNQGSFGFLFGDKLLFVAHGDVIAGVDLAKLDPEDLYTEDGVLYVILPEAEIFIATLDNEKSYVYDRETGVFSQGEVDLETSARLAAEEAILESAHDDGILEQAQINAENYLIRLLRDLGYPDVVFLEPKPDN
jgi:hypothetical protein